MIVYKAAKLIEARFHIGLLWIGRTKVCSTGHGHVTKMATMPIYGKHALKKFSQANWLMTFELGIQH